MLHSPQHGTQLFHGDKHRPEPYIPPNGIGIHPFEDRHLGRAPFRLVRVVLLRYKVAPDAPSQPGACCDYCGTPIVETCFIADADGYEFHVGNECVKRTFDRSLIDPVQRELVRLRKEAKATADAERIQKGRQRLTDDADLRSALASLPHPFFPNSMSLLSYVEYLMANGGTSGKVRACRLMDKAKAA